MRMLGLPDAAVEHGSFAIRGEGIGAYASMGSDSMRVVFRRPLHAWQVSALTHAYRKPNPNTAGTPVSIQIVIEPTQLGHPSLFVTPQIAVNSPSVGGH